MIISAKNLRKYLHLLEYPVTILEEKGERAAFLADRADLESLIAQGSVVGVGSWSRVKRIRLNRSVRSSEQAGVPVEPVVFEQEYRSAGIRYRDPNGMRWVAHHERAKTGRIGHASHLPLKTAHEKVYEVVPGGKALVERRVVA